MKRFKGRFIRKPLTIEVEKEVQRVSPEMVKDFTQSEDPQNAKSEGENVSLSEEQTEPFEAEVTPVTADSSNPVPEGSKLPTDENVTPIPKPESQAEAKTVEETATKPLSPWKRKLANLMKRFSFAVGEIRNVRSSRTRADRPQEEFNRYLSRRGLGQLFVKKGWVLILVLVILLILSILGTNWLRERNTESSAEENLFNETVTKLDEVRRISYSDEQRKEAYEKAQEALSTLRTANFDNTKIKQLEDNMVQLQDSLYHVTRISEPTLLTDLTLKKEGAVGVDMSFIGTNLYVLDAQNHELFIVHPDTGNTDLVTLAEENAPQLLLNNEDALFMYTSTNVSQFDSGSGALSEEIGKTDEWQSIVDLGSYFGNIYLLDTGAKQIWKYAVIADGFSDPIAYITAGPEEGLEKATAMAIDGSIYVLLQDGEVRKYLLQQKQNFDVTGLDTPLTDAIDIYTTEDFTLLYLLDRTGKKLIVLDKNGVYQRQFTSDAFSDLKALTVSADEKTAYLLSGSQIYELSLDR